MNNLNSTQPYSGIEKNANIYRKNQEKKNLAIKKRKSSKIRKFLLVGSIVSYIISTLFSIPCIILLIQSQSSDSDRVSSIVQELADTLKALSPLGKSLITLIPFILLVLVLPTISIRKNFKQDNDAHKTDHDQNVSDGIR